VIEEVVAEAPAVQAVVEAPAAVEAEAVAEVPAEVVADAPAADATSND
jgi:hypothetical protein